MQQQRRWYQTPGPSGQFFFKKQRRLNMFKTKLLTVAGGRAKPAGA